MRILLVCLFVVGCGPLEPTVPTDRPPPPRAQRFNTCAQLRALWPDGVRMAGGTYDPSWNHAERRTYALNYRRLDEPGGEIPYNPPGGMRRTGDDRSTATGGYLCG